jgi:hypothetical protein
MQAAFVRLVSNPAFSRDAVTPQEAITLLTGNLKHRCHRFWSDEIRGPSVLGGDVESQDFVEVLQVCVIVPLGNDGLEVAGGQFVSPAQQYPQLPAGRAIEWAFPARDPAPHFPNPGK